MFGPFNVAPFAAPKSCFLQGESDNSIQFGATNSYSDGIVLSKATGKENYLMNLLIEISQVCNPRITYSTIQVTKTLMLVLIMTPRTVASHIFIALDHIQAVVCGYNLLLVRMFKGSQNRFEENKNCETWYGTSWRLS